MEATAMTVVDRPGELCWPAAIRFPASSSRSARARGEGAGYNFRNMMVYRVSQDLVHPAIRSGRVQCKQISSPTRGEAD